MTEYDSVTITIYNSNNLELDEFIASYLIPNVQKYLIGSIDTKRLIKYDEYLNSLPGIQMRIPSGKKVYVSSYDLIVGAVNNLIFTKQPNNNYIIEINPNEIAPKLVAKFIDVARLINYGSLSLPAYPLFSKSFEFFENNMQQCYESYLMKR